MVVVWSLVILVVALSQTEGFCPTSAAAGAGAGTASRKAILRHIPSSVLKASSSFDDKRPGGKLKVKRNKSQKERTLYEVLGASPSDSQEKLKQRYTALVRKLHPDAQVGKTSPESANQLASELSDINAAWQVLSDPKERLKYDRELKAKEFADGLESGVESLVKFGFNTAVPWLKKTADTTAAAVETSSKVVNQGAAEAKRAVDQRAAEAKKAYSIFEMDQTAKQLEKRAAMELSQAAKYKDELANLSDNRMSVLKDPNAILTGAEARKIMKQFDVRDYLPSVEKDINSFLEMEQRHKESTQNGINLEKATQLAERQVDLALKAEELALKKLEDAQQALAEARASKEAAQKAQKEATDKEKYASLDLDKAVLAVNKAKEKVRLGLLKHETKYLEREAQYLKQECARLEESAKSLQRDADRKKREAKKL